MHETFPILLAQVPCNVMGSYLILYISLKKLIEGNPNNASNIFFISALLHAVKFHIMQTKILLLGTSGQCMIGSKGLVIEAQSNVDKVIRL